MVQRLTPMKTSHYLGPYQYFRTCSLRNRAKKTWKTCLIRSFRPKKFTWTRLSSRTLRFATDCFGEPGSATGGKNSYSTSRGFSLLRPEKVDVGTARPSDQSLPRARLRSRPDLSGHFRPRFRRFPATGARRERAGRDQAAKFFGGGDVVAVVRWFVSRAVGSSRSLAAVSRARR